jgi:hypothetical protein
MDPIKRFKRDLSEKQSISRPNSFVFRNNPSQASSTFVDTPSIADKRFDVTERKAQDYFSYIKEKKKAEEEHAAKKQKAFASGAQAFPAFNYPEFSGGSKEQPYDGGSIRPMSRSGHRYSGPSISELLEYGPGQKPGHMWDKNLPDDYYEPASENFLEFFDPTGILSHDDARASYDTWKKSGRAMPTLDESLNMISAIPAIGKLKILGRIAYQPKLFDFLQGSWNTFIATAESAKKIDRFSDFKELMQQFDEYLSRKI